MYSEHWNINICTYELYIKHIESSLIYSSNHGFGSGHVGSEPEQIVYIGWMDYGFTLGEILTPIYTKLPSLNWLNIVALLPKIFFFYCLSLGIIKI
jgi:hypothetical protein